MNTPAQRYSNLLHIVFVLFALSATTLGGWAVLNRPDREVPPWPKEVSGYAYAPFRADQSPIKNVYPSREQIDEDLRLMATHTKHVRIYSVKDVQAEIPRLAAKYGMSVTVGGWLTDQREENLRELNRLIDVVNANANVDRIIVGNETLLREELTGEDLIAYINYVRQGLNRKVPISTADSWDFWIKEETANLGKTVDFIGAHFLPYWLGKQLDTANDDVVASYKAIQKVWGKKPILIAEVGWPSRGRERGDADASPADEGKFLRKFLALADKEKYDYFIMEAFDQPWKMGSEGSVGAYWGVWDANRQLKFPLTGAVRPIPEWRTLVSVTIALAVLTFLALLIDADLLRKRALSFLAIVAFIATSAMVWIAYQMMDPYATTSSIVLGVVLAVSAIGVLTVLLVEAHEWAEAVWSLRRRRPFGKAVEFGEGLELKVSIHVPCYNEPPEMVIETIEALRKLRYKNYEVLIIDNNTKDEDVWKPVEEYCAKLNDPRYRFFHVAPIAGFKAGALNFGTRNTSPDVDVIAVIDSDYQVSPNWLSDLVPHFSNPKIAIVQAPQDYRDGNDNLFKRMCNAEYQGFFHIGMVTRNDRNAIIQHGTMTMVRKSVLEELGGWDENCITEDAELGLRVFNAGLEAAYIEDSYGQGLIPDNFVDFRKQRFRWAYGAMAIMRKHARPLFLGGETQLTKGQRYHFIAGWLPWVADGMNLFFTLGAIIWSIGMIAWPLQVDPPLSVYAIPPLSLFFFKLAKLYYVYRKRVGTDHLTTWFAALAGLALSYVISKAMVYGIVTTKVPFLRTPKMKDRESWWFALLLVTEELCIAVVLWLCALGVAIQQDWTAGDVKLWVSVLIIQSLPYAAAVVMSLISANPFEKPVTTENTSTVTT